ncbi:hypothetical protein D3OALGA1CA_4584 [Olavius algarvensis associated proteobacterium Delta 3]|nr:hypothetical protein D3OALGB2SA_4221 [Olavius algarvensis associated proteobacterium Delta 3]CAB5153745.1 hypothetical protein D3OALGA1CA_4584 [Olavius algarvensis associated proteobacterium Delta 3]
MSTACIVPSPNILLDIDIDCDACFRKTGSPLKPVARIVQHFYKNKIFIKSISYKNFR